MWFSFKENHRKMCFSALHVWKVQTLECMQARFQHGPAHLFVRLITSKLPKRVCRFFHTAEWGSCNLFRRPLVWEPAFPVSYIWIIFEQLKSLRLFSEVTFGPVQERLLESRGQITTSSLPRQEQGSIKGAAWVLEKTILILAMDWELYYHQSWICFFFIFILVFISFVVLGAMHFLGATLSRIWINANNYENKL